MMTAMDVKYVGIDEELSFTEAPYIYGDYDALDYEWDVHATPLINGRGVSINKFSRPSKKFSLTINVLAHCQKDFDKHYYKLLEVLENNIYKDTPGKLYIGEDYIECYAVESSKGNYLPFAAWREIEIEFFAPYGAWFFENTLSFYPGQQSELSVGKKYAYKYSYKYAKDGKGEVVRNRSLTPALANFKIYGATENPSFTIGGRRYEVFEKVEAGEYIEIDQRNRTVEKVYKNGFRENIFGKRGKINSVFEPIPVGDYLLVASGAFGIDITLYEERSEPRWI